MKDLIEALQILLKYGDPTSPTHCEHDVLSIAGINPDDVSEDDKLQLDSLGFFVSDEYGVDEFRSYRFASA